MASSRATLRAAIGDAGLVDAAGVIANFDATDKIADASGVQLSQALLDKSENARSILGLDAMRKE